MSYAGTRYEGTVMLNQRINYFSGHAPEQDDDHPMAGLARRRGWLVTRHVPKRPLWAASTHSLGTKRHLVDYQLVATHKYSGVVVKITRWKCGARCYSELQTGEMDEKTKCWTCRRYA